LFPQKLVYLQNARSVNRTAQKIRVAFLSQILTRASIIKAMAVTG
jgi:hypothetical protein